MKDFLLNKDGDLDIGENGDVTITDSIEQAISIRLSWFANEWSLGPNLGVPYYEEVLTKNPSRLLLESRLKEAVESIDGVEEVDLASDIDAKTRKLTVAYNAKVQGKPISGRLMLNV